MDSIEDQAISEGGVFVLGGLVGVVGRWTSLVAVIALVGCSKRFKPSEVAGTYEAQYDVASEELTLKPNGTFLQRVTYKADGHELATSGVWRLYDEGHEVACESTFINVLDGFGHEANPPERGNVSLPVRYWLGIVVLGGDPGTSYKRRRSP